MEDDMKRLASLALAASLCAALIGCATGGAAQKPAAAPEQPAAFNLNAIAIYTMEKADGSDLIDESGNGLNAFIGGDFEQGEGKVGKAMVFNGEDNFLKLPTEVLDGDGWTFAAWVNPDAWPDWARVFDMGDGGSSDIWMGFSGVEKKMRMDIFKAGANPTVLGDTLPIGEWSHIAVTLNGSFNCMYINGELTMKTFGKLLPKDVIKKNAYVGRSNWGADPLFKGRMDEIIIARTAYTQDQIKAISKGIPVGK
jgi:arabinan endo-1,5-alpha-L-arabinosidase